MTEGFEERKSSRSPEISKLINMNSHGSIFKNLAFVEFVFIALFSCEEDPEPPCDDNGLPCLTSEGKNTFACRVDGAVFIPNAGGSIGGAPKISMEFDQTTKRLAIAGNKIDSEDRVENIGFLVYITDDVGV